MASTVEHTNAAIAAYDATRLELATALSRRSCLGDLQDRIDSLGMTCGAGLTDGLEAMTKGDFSVAATGRVGVGTVLETRRAFDRVSSTIDSVSTCVERLAVTTQDVAALARDTSANSEQVSASTEQTNAGTQHVAASSGHLADTARELRDLVASFRVGA